MFNYMRLCGLLGIVSNGYKCTNFIDQGGGGRRNLCLALLAILYKSITYNTTRYIQAGDCDAWDTFIVFLRELFSPPLRL